MILHFLAFRHIYLPKTETASPSPDIMDLLKAELAKKRKLLESKSLVSNEKKFFKREELIQKEEEDYWKRQAEKEAERSRKNKINAVKGDSDSGDEGDLAAMAKSPEEIAKMKLKKFITHQAGASSGSDSKGGKEEERIMPRKDVIKRFRDRNEPILLFGESEVDAFRRLRKYEILEPDVSDRGLRNDFQVCLSFAGYCHTV